MFLAAKTKKEAYNASNHVLRSIYAYMHANKLHINLSKCAHMYFRPNLNYRECMKCARSEWLGRVTGLKLSLTRFNVLKTLHIFPLNDCLLLLKQVDKKNS